MKSALLLKLGRHMVPLPAFVWRRVVAREAGRLTHYLRFMTPEHHRVRNFVVNTIAVEREPLALPRIVDASQLSEPRCAQILDELEDKLFFLHRNSDGEVVWAYPVTADATPHHLAFESGERMTAA